MPESAFAAQVDWLAGRCTVVPLREAIALLSDVEADALPVQPIVAITFDDGYGDNAEIAAPLLEQAGVRGTFFITTQPVESQSLLWFDVAASAHGGGQVEAMKRMSPAQRARELASINGASRQPANAASFAMMTPEQVRGLALRGHEIGAHTVTHPILTQLSDDEVRGELAPSRLALEAWTGAPVTGFAYPNGDHDDRIVALTRQAGFTYACTTEPGSHATEDDTMRIRRLDITPHRVCDAHGKHDELAFRSELCQLREHMR
jgi:peptidoglycan/xylan/chitin deacetylase (PgdA/CDA1 family)